MRLIAAELLRARSRRATWIILSGLVGLCLFFLGGNFVSTSMPSDQELAEQRVYFERDLADWKLNHQQYYDSCVSDAAANEQSPVDWGCEGYLEEPTFENYTWSPDGFAERVTRETTGLLILAAALMFLLGASLTAAEHATGSLGNWLTFEPRRSRVFFSKLAAPAVVAVCAAALVTALGVLGTAAWTELRGIPSPEPLDTGKLVGAILRTSGVVVAAAVLGAALGSLLRHTAAVIGVVAGYFVVVEMVFRGMFWESALHGWFVSTRLLAITEGKTSYFVNVCAWNQDELYRECTQVEKFITAADATLYLGSIGLVLVVVSWLAFRRRDVH
ncbi:ABC transporter permease subunit [Sanguibacter massiliensis]|uniref:ABC transporter permease subunit n=1 Tax=Sanguibacter massiliensis TaxID=1973217 RepID=UPI000C823CB5|nr:ABC transporter permease subunit [Sanguibacter massiliensis]